MPMSETAAPDYAERMPPSWAEAIARAPNPYEVSLARYARAPIAFVREVLLAEPDDRQLEGAAGAGEGAHAGLRVRMAATGPARPRWRRGWPCGLVTQEHRSSWR